MFKIDKGIPIPDGKIGLKKEPTEMELTLMQMKVGDSFEHPEEADEKKIRWRLTKVTRQFGFKFSVRMVLGKMRIWRIK